MLGEDEGARRTNLDKRRAVERALTYRPGESDRAIAEWCGVSHNFVSESRARLSSDDSQPTTRTGKDGRTINTANIGKGERSQKVTEAALSPLAPVQEDQGEQDDHADEGETKQARGSAPAGLWCWCR